MENYKIQGVWTSENSSKEETIRYYFGPNSNYRYDERDTDGTWHTLHQGLYAYEDGMLALQYNDGQWYNMGYVGIESNGNIYTSMRPKHMVQGFKRTAPGEGIEGAWVLDNGGMVFQGMKPCFLNHRITVTFANGLMNGTSEYITDGKPSNVSTFSGKYTTEENNVIVIAEAANAPTMFLSDGPKKVCIIDDVLGLFDETTVGSYFTLVPQDDWCSKLKKMDRPVSQFTCYCYGGYVGQLVVAFKKPDELTWNTHYPGKKRCFWTENIRLEEISGLEDGMDVRLELDVHGGIDIKAKEYFTYRKDAGLLAYYESTGTVFKNQLSFIEYRTPEE